ncbi:MAG: hypothetical protein SGJ10_11930 [Bacteroidota bacterium]|nr:hypothetical protein [Bacteroidota bacterium]
MKKLYILFALILFIFEKSHGQRRQFGQIDRLDSIVNNFTVKLNNNGVSKIIYTKHYCESMIPHKCGNVIYIFWKNAAESYIKKFDGCIQYAEFKITNSNFFDFYEKFKDTIKDEEVHPFQTEVKENHKITSNRDSGSAIIFPATISIYHYCGREIIIYDQNDTIEKYFNYFELEYKSGEDININYNANNKLKLVQWDKRTNELIEQLEAEKKFVSVK